MVAQPVLVKGTNFFSCQNIPIYFRSVVTDERAFMVLELVLSVIVEDVVVRQYTIGWTTLDCFSRSNITDLLLINTRIYDPELSKLDEKDEEREKKELERARGRNRGLTMFAGTSRSLLVQKQFDKGNIFNLTQLLI